MENFNVSGPPDNRDWTIIKSGDDKKLVFGWASISFTADGEQLEDLQHDLINPEDLEEAVYEYVLNFRDTGEEHRPHLRKKGKLVESCVFTAEKQKAMGLPEGILPVGWWIGFKIEDDEAWEKVKNGTYKMFSIEGKAQRVPVEKAVETVEKFNPNHGPDGKFVSGGAGGSSGSAWSYPGIAEATSKIENQVANVKTHEQAAAVYTAIQRQEKVIERALADIENGVEEGDKAALMTQRRKLRMAQRKLLQNQVVGKSDDDRYDYIIEDFP